MIEYVQLVDEQDTAHGVMEKMQAHREGRLHRAVSVFILNGKGEMLLQKRAGGKYHSAGLWTNACCTHPHPGELPLDSANRRLMEEMGLACILKPVFSMIYRAELDQDLIEHEFDHVFTGISDELPLLNPEEASEYKYLPLAGIAQLLEESPQQFTEWFRLLFPRVREIANSPGY